MAVRPLPVSLLSLILSHLPHPLPPQLPLVCRLFHTLCTTHISLSSPQSYRAYLGTTETFDQPRPAWASTTHLDLAVGGWSDNVANVWIPRMAYLLDRGVGEVEGGFGQNVTKLEVAFGGEGWVGSVAGVLVGLLTKGAFPRLQHLVMTEYTVRGKTSNPTVKTKPAVKTSKGRGRRVPAPEPDLIETAKAVDPLAPTPGSIKFLAKLVAATSLHLLTLALPLSHLVHPSSPLATPPAYIPCSSTLIVAAPSASTSEEATQQLLDWLEGWLGSLFDLSESKKGKKAGRTRATQVLDLRGLAECIEEDGMEALGGLIEEGDTRWDVLV